ncbi:MAG: M56 family metallopeptidase [Gammaproteobacteria bacterium]
MTTIITSLDLLQAHSPVFYFWVDTFIKASLIVLIALLLRWTFRRQSASSHSLIWLIALASCLCLPLFKLITPRIEFAVSFTVSDAAPALGYLAEQLLETPAEFFARLTILAEFLGWFYLAGVLFMVARLLTGVLSLAGLSKRAYAVPGHPAHSLLAGLLNDNGSAAEVELLFSPGAQTPFTWGVVRHRLILPETALEWEPAPLTQAIGHELGHIQRNDWIAQMLGRLALCIYWPNPLLWHAVRRMKLASEHACDDAAVDSCGSAVEYASSLLKLASRTRHRLRPLNAAIGLIPKASELGLRIRHIVHSDRNREFLRADEICAATTATLLLVIPFSSIELSARIVEPTQAARAVVPVSFGLPAGNLPSDAAYQDTALINPVLNPPRQFQSGSRTVERLNTPPGAAQTGQLARLAVADSPSALADNIDFTVSPEALFKKWEAAPLIVSAPAYPPHALQRGIEGHVVAEFSLDEEGRVRETTIIESVPTGVFDTAVLRAVKKFVYCPEVVDGIGGNNQPIRKRFSFALDGLL